MLTCLVVDDANVVRKVARRILEDFDLEVAEAGEGNPALDMCRNSMPDFILLDWQLPDMDGLEFLTSLRTMEGGKEPKVVFCTSEADVAQIAKALRAGADEYLLKPFNRSIVEAKLQDIGLL